MLSFNYLVSVLSKASLWYRFNGRYGVVVSGSASQSTNACQFCHHGSALDGCRNGFEID